MPLRILASCVVSLCLLGATPGSVFAVEAALDVDVPAERWKTVRLKSLPRGASVSLQIVASDTIRVIVVDGSELKRFPHTRALFAATVDRRLGFSVVIPKSGDYYVVFDNRTSTQPRQVSLSIKAEPPARRPRAPQAKERLDQM